MKSGTSRDRLARIRVNRLRRGGALFRLLLAPVLFASGPGAAAAEPPTVGAIRWDAWFGPDPSSRAGAAVEKSLGPAHWHYRLPFYAEVSRTGAVSIRGDTQTVMDRELSYGRAAGLSYFAYLMYDESTAQSRALALHRQSANPDKINFCLILTVEVVNGVVRGDASVADGRDEWTKHTRERLLGYFGGANYQKVLGGRPLLFVFSPKNLEEKLGGPGGLAAVLADLAAASEAQGTGKPYCVVMSFDAGGAERSRLASGAQAVSSYSTPFGSADGRPYSDLMLHERKLWDSFRLAGGGSDVVPWVTLGWDKRPRLENPVPWEDATKETYGHFVSPASPRQIGEQTSAALAWVSANRTAAPANTVLVYAWNEFDEGGWLCPTLRDGPDRVNEFARVLGGRGVVDGSRPAKAGEP